MRPAILNGLFSNIDTLNGIGPKWSKLLKNLCGPTVLSVAFHLPDHVLHRPYLTDLKSVREKMLLTTKVTVSQHKKPFSRRHPYRIICEASGTYLEVVFFNYRKDYIIDQLPVGETRLISGQVERFGERLQMTHPDYIVREEEAWKIPIYEPIYPLTQGVSNKLMNRATKEALQLIPNLPEWLEETRIRQEGWPSFKEALFQAHHPQTEADFSSASKARQRLAYDELLANQLALVLARTRMKKQTGTSIQGSGILRQKLLSCLPFELTNAQKRVVSEIETDMQSPYRMLRLLQGDVGSGKTIVGLIALLNAVEAGFQGALMAPTDILVRQHFAKISQLCIPLGINVVLLTGREKGKKREEILSQIANGQAQIVIGTHALFTDDVIFNKLGLVIIDEQHRFGVEQRLALTQKGKAVDVLVMTATPIPRTLALTYYGDMDLSQIDEKPPTRKPVDTRVLSVKKMEAVIQKLHVALAEGKQVYWVCPLVEETEKSDLANATARFETLSAVFPGQVGLIHGKMPGSDKDTIMNAFVRKETSVLVATTVIEVGVDVPNACIMIIEQAERFGLSQLHQLRGRIGRGTLQSTCLLLYDYPLSDTARKRLDVMRSTEDGFIIAEEDLKLRGAGEVLGTRQSGLETFQLTSIELQGELLPIVRREAVQIIQTDPTLSSPRGEKLKTLLYLFNKDKEIQTIKAG